MKKKIIFLTLTFILITFSGLVYSNEPSPTPGENSQNWQSCATKTNKNGNAHQYCTPKEPLLIKIDESKVANQNTDTQRQNIEQKSFIEHTVEIISPFLSAIATIAIAIFTIFLVIYNKKMWETTAQSVAVAKESADAAKKSAEVLPITERAYLFIDDVKQREQHANTVIAYGNDRIIGINIEIKNYGHTPAIIDDSSIKIQYRVDYPNEGDLEMLFLKPIPPNTIIASGKPFIHTGEIKIPRVELMAIERGDTYLFCEGEIKYKDIFKENHRTWFSWHWKHELNCFKISNLDYENGYD